MFSLTGKIAAITGAGSGIGREIALLFARQGAQIAVLELGEEAGRQTVDAITREGGRAASFSCDVAESAQVQEAFAGVSDRFQRLDILVNNAGVSAIGKVEDTTAEDFDRVYRVNVKGTYHCLQAGVRQMLKQGGGVILNLASIASLIGLEDRFAYSMSKGAVLTMTRSVAVDYIKRNIRCNCICPARIHTPFVDDYLAQNYPGREQEMFEKLANYQPIGRMGTPAEVAALALYLCSDEAAFVTGQAYPLDGGVLVF